MQKEKSPQSKPAEASLDRKPNAHKRCDWELKPGLIGASQKWKQY